MLDQPAPPAEDESPGSAASRDWIWIAGMGAVVVVLTVLLFQSRPTAKEEPSPELAALEEVIRQEQANIDAERARRGLPPLYASSTQESMLAVAERLRNDAETLASFANGQEQILAAKDAEIAAARQALHDSKAQFAALARQITELQQKLDAAARVEDEDETLRLGAENAAARVAELEKALADANARLAELQDAPSAIELEELRRQLEEARSARKFFETRAASLEEQLAAEGKAADDGEAAEPEPALPLPQD